MLKVVERVTEKTIRECIVIDDIQFGFMSGCGTTDALQCQTSSRKDKNKNLYFAFIDLEKTLDRGPRKVIWWAMHVVGVPE